MVDVWLREVEEDDAEGNAICTGRFECMLERDDEVEELPFEAAVAWARAHAQRAYIDIELERYTLFGDDREIPRLPPELAARLTEGLRRPEADAWRDRADEAPPVRWEVEVALSPPGFRDDARSACEQVVERVAGRLAAAGCEQVIASSDELDASLADKDRAWRAAGKPEVFGWMTTHRHAFVLTAVVDAPAYRPVLARVREAVLDEVEAAAGRAPHERGAEDIADRWGVEVRVRPPGYEWRPPAL